MHEPDPVTANHPRRSEPNVYSGERRINTYRVTARDPDCDSHPSAGDRVRTRASNPHIRIPNQSQPKRERAQDDRHQSHHQ